MDDCCKRLCRSLSYQQNAPTPTFLSTLPTTALYFLKTFSMANYQLQTFPKSTCVLPVTNKLLLNLSKFYFVLFLVYAALGGTWGWLCYKHRDDLLPIQVRPHSLRFVRHSNRLVVLSFRSRRVPCCRNGRELGWAAHKMQYHDMLKDFWSRLLPIFECSWEDSGFHSIFIRW